MKKIISLITLFVALASTISCNLMPNRTTASIGSCPILPNSPPLFNVLENNHENITVQLNNFVKFFKLPANKYDVRVTYEDTDTKDFKYFGRATTIELLKAVVSQEPSNIQIETGRSGIYLFELSYDGKTFWKQKVFAVAKEENSLSSEEKQALATQYAPVLEMSPDEMYYPTSLEYILNKEDPDPSLDSEPFRLTNKQTQSKLLSFFSKDYKFTVDFQYKDIDKILPYYGNYESVLKSGLTDDKQTRLRHRTGKENLVVYYSIFENKKYNEIYINYHFFYAFDSKNGSRDKVAMAAHIFDRESLTVVLRTQTRKPLYAFYGAHLPSQMMAQLDSNEKVVQSWLTGRVFVNWPDTIKENNRLKAVAAKGSHGIYPIKGLYAVMLNENIKLLLEPAGGGEKLYPNFDETAGNNPKYQLRYLELESVTSDCNNGINALAFSGSTVDVLGPTNATFPPFTDREGDYKNYLDPNAPLFDMKKAAAAQ